MDSLQQQVSELTQQIANLRDQVHELKHHLLGMLTTRVPETNGAIAWGHSPQEHNSQEHKDILVEKSHPTWSSHINEMEISSEWQVRRLTAQLTTAYNRIAALEEELLSRRIAR